eukprot:778713-Pelagomonas_calceolata.AAC.8
MVDAIKKLGVVPECSLARKAEMWDRACAGPRTCTAQWCYKWACLLNNQQDSWQLETRHHTSKYINSQHHEQAIYQWTTPPQKSVLEWSLHSAPNFGHLSLVPRRACRVWRRWRSDCEAVRDEEYGDFGIVYGGQKHRIVPGWNCGPFWGDLRPEG